MKKSPEFNTGITAGTIEIRTQLSGVGRDENVLFRDSKGRLFRRALVTSSEQAAEGMQGFIRSSGRDYKVERNGHIIVLASLNSLVPVAEEKEVSDE